MSDFRIAAAKNLVTRAFEQGVPPQNQAEYESACALLGLNPNELARLRSAAQQVTRGRDPGVVLSASGCGTRTRASRSSRWR